MGFLKSFYSILPNQFSSWPCAPRDQALGVKASVDDLLTGLGPEENSLSNLEDSLQDALDNKDTVEDRLVKVGTRRGDLTSPSTPGVGNLWPGGRVWEGHMRPVSLF